MSTPPAVPVTVLVCALGGEGGGVLAEWLYAAAVGAGLHAQSTSIPGVAQRTGATTYYIEIQPGPAGARRPVFSLNPVPGAIDLLVSSELLETVRQVGQGMASAARTRIISSTARALTVAEKMVPGDGRVDAARESRNHDATGFAECPRQILGEAQTVEGSIARADDRDRGLAPQMRVSAHGENRRCILDVPQQLGIVGFAQADQPRVERREALEFGRRLGLREGFEAAFAAALCEFRQRGEGRVRCTVAAQQLPEGDRPDIFGSVEAQPIAPLGGCQVADDHASG